MSHRLWWGVFLLKPFLEVKMDLQSLDGATWVENTIVVQEDVKDVFRIVSDQARFAEFITGLPVRLVTCEGGAVKAVVYVGGYPLELCFNLKKEEDEHEITLHWCGDSDFGVEGQIWVEWGEIGSVQLRTAFLYSLDNASIAAEQISHEAVETAIGRVLDAVKTVIEADA